MTNITKTDSTPQHQVLDSCLLGRPVHLLHVFAAQLRDDLAGAMRLPLSRRYWGAYQVDAVAFSRIDGEAPRGRWLSFGDQHGQIGFLLERQVLLGVLNQRYGRSGAKAAAAPDPQTVRVTTTEERLAVVLGQHMVAALLARVRHNLAALDKAAPLGIPAAAELSAAPGTAPARGSWVVGVGVSDGAAGAGIGGQFWFALDKAAMADVLHGLLPEREQAKKALKSVRPLAARLQVTLEGRLVSKEVQLGALFDLRVGDVIPVSLNRTDVMLADSRLFTAAVSEHKGKLCLTSFEDVE
ncbi:flagellar motor switch protein FliM [Janthinobacterium sp. CG_23.3]|uniref:FliM/FliN family flagellar motor switch protein n=1 Tax=unclassified Janthinobacterium TaxID=2610881 RepID=UPI00036DA87A|nr:MULTISPECIES: FliM/FliN family flagellar motor switch protein [unclassified Janthinobacterium]MEC5160638.1 flagellar motor switch protein FliM [Janthinobacterium sp. CG_S6]